MSGINDNQDLLLAKFNGKISIETMPPTLSLFGPVPPGTSSLGGFICLTIALLGLLSIPAQLPKMNLSKQWPKLTLEVIVLLFLVFVGLAIIARNHAR